MLFATVIALWTLVTLLMKLIRIFLKWKYIQDQNYAILATKKVSLCCESETILFKEFRPSHRAGVFLWENIYLGHRDLAIVAGPAPPLKCRHRYFLIQRKEWRGEFSETRFPRTRLDTLFFVSQHCYRLTGLI